MQSLYMCKCVTTNSYKNKSRTGRSNLRISNQRLLSSIQSVHTATLQTPSATWTKMDEAVLLEIQRKDGPEEVSKERNGDMSSSFNKLDRTSYLNLFGLLGLLSAAFLSQADSFSTNLNRTELGSGSSNISSSSQIDSIGELYNSSVTSSYRNGYFNF